MKSIRRAALPLVAAALLPLLAACSQKGESPDKAPETTGTQTTAPGLTVSNARVVMAPVAGNPAAVYFDLSYAGAPGVSLTGVEVEGAGMTMIHDYAESAGQMRMTMADTVPLAQGTPLAFAPGGLHVMAKNPAADLKPGGTAMVTLTLSNGSKVSVAAPVRAAGEER